MRVVHAHDLLNILVQSGELLPVSSLKALAGKKFGAGAAFTNCTGNLYSFEEILEFLAARDKIEFVNGGITVKVERICDHE